VLGVEGVEGAGELFEGGLGFFEAEVAGGLEGVEGFGDAGDEDLVGGDVEV